MNKEVGIFDFRIITCADGSEIIDRKLKTPEDSLTAVQKVEYIETEATLYCIDRMERKARVEAEQRQKLIRNPLYRLACLCGLV